MFKEIKEYFTYNPQNPDLGSGGILLFLWILSVTGGKSLAIFIPLFIYMAYSGNKYLIILGSLSVLTLPYFSFHYSNDTIVENIFLSLFLTAFFRDIYFIWKYNHNIFASKNTDKQKITRISFLIYLGIVFLLCLGIFLIRQIF